MLVYHYQSHGSPGSSDGSHKDKQANDGELHVVAVMQVDTTVDAATTIAPVYVQ